MAKSLLDDRFVCASDDMNNAARDCVSHRTETILIFSHMHEAPRRDDDETIFHFIFPNKRFSCDCGPRPATDMLTHRIDCTTAVGERGGACDWLGLAELVLGASNGFTGIPTRYEYTNAHSAL